MYPKFAPREHRGQSARFLRYPQVGQDWRWNRKCVNPLALWQKPLGCIKESLGRQVMCLQFSFLAFYWAVWVGASWDGAPVLLPRCGRGATTPTKSRGGRWWGCF